MADPVCRGRNARIDPLWVVPPRPDERAAKPPGWQTAVVSNEDVKGRTWFERDYPVLLAAVDQCQASAFNQTTTHAVAAATGMDVGEVVKAVANLKEVFLHVNDVSTLGARDYIITGATERGLVAAEVWPSPEIITERLVAAIERALDETPTGSPKATKLVTLLGAVKDVSTGTSAGLLAMLVGRALGLPT